MKFEKLCDAVDDSRQKMERFLDNRREAIKEFVGMHYSDNGSLRRVPTNFLELAITIYVRLLSARTPRCMVNTDIASLRPFAADMEAALNQIPGDIHLGETLRRAVVEAIFSMAVVKVGIVPRGKTEDGKPYAEPFVSLVQLDDYFVDMSAKSWDEIQFEGNEYWMEVDQVREFYGVDLAEDDYSGTSSSGTEQAKAIENNSHTEIYNGRVLLRDVYVVRENKMVTYAVQTKQILRCIDWDGPEGTPYIRLWFTDVPGNLMPLAPVAVWRDLHELGNSIFRKLAVQADSKKTVAVFQGGNDEDIQRLKNASDGSGIRYNGSKPEAIAIGGVDPQTLGFFLQLKDLYNMFAGNLDSLGGLSPQADTATQEKLITEATGARMQNMSDRTVEFAQAIFKRLAWYLWTDPVRERTIHKIANKQYGIGISKKWTPETRDGDFLDYNFEIDVFSIQDDSPATRVQKVITAFERVIFPLMPMMEQQGAYIDMKELTDYVGKNSNIPELSSFLKFQSAPPEEEQIRGNPTPALAEPRKSPYSRHVYERVNRPGATRHGRDDVLSRILMGANAQSSEVNALSAGRSMA